MNIQCLYGFIPNKVFDQLPEVIKRFNLNTETKLAHFLGQCASETGFSSVEENLNYSAKRLWQKFSKRVKTYAKAQLIANDPVKIGSCIYADRIGNGNEASQEGYKFRGRGYIQLTGKSNYEAFSKYIGEDCVSNPDIVATKYPLVVAGWYFANRVKNKANNPVNRTGVASVTDSVKGSSSGYQGRLILTQKYEAMIRCRYTGKDYHSKDNKRKKINTKIKRKSFR
jgi:putative chitinase